MPFDLNSIDTVVILMMENRSFDHMLGYLSLPAVARSEVDGLKDDYEWRLKYANAFNNKSYYPFRLSDPNKKLVGDPPHERKNIAVQLGQPNPTYPMNGFVESFASFDPDANLPLVMSHFEADDLPSTDFFARNFAIFNRWFSSLPAGTQPNRLMAMSGYSKIDVNADLTLPEQDLVYDWLTARGIRWRVYHDGIPFFAMMPRMIPTILEGDKFKSYSQFRVDIKGEDTASFPQVIFIEPRYTDAPHIDPPADDHAPSPMSNGQKFLKRVYTDLISNPDRWSKSVLIVTYDEHGGFFDHVPPDQTVKTSPPPGENYPRFESTGVRVPAFVISPYVQPLTVVDGLHDHVSILKFLAQKFDGGHYSPEVDARPTSNMLEVFSPVQRVEIPYPDEDPAVGYTQDRLPDGPLPSAFDKALHSMQESDPEKTLQRFPDLVRGFTEP